MCRSSPVCGTRSTGPQSVPGPGLEEKAIFAQVQPGLRNQEHCLLKGYSLSQDLGQKKTLFLLRSSPVCGLYQENCLLKGRSLSQDLG